MAEGTKLTLDHLLAAMRRLRDSCAGCGGNGTIVAESFEHFMARVSTALHVRGEVTMEEAMLRLRRCPACNGTGRIEEKVDD